MALSEYTKRIRIYLTRGEADKFHAFRKRTNADVSSFGAELIKQGLIEIIKTNGLVSSEHPGRTNTPIEVYISLIVRKKFIELRPRYHDKDSGFGRDLINLAMKKMAT